MRFRIVLSIVALVSAVFSLSKPAKAETTVVAKAFFGTQVNAPVIDLNTGQVIATKTSLEPGLYRTLSQTTMFCWPDSTSYPIVDNVPLSGGEFILVSTDPANEIKSQIWDSIRLATPTPMASYVRKKDPVTGRSYCTWQCQPGWTCMSTCGKCYQIQYPSNMSFKLFNPAQVAAYSAVTMLDKIRLLATPPPNQAATCDSRNNH